MTLAESAIARAIMDIEHLGTGPLLAEARAILVQAQEKVAAHIEADAQQKREAFKKAHPTVTCHQDFPECRYDESYFCHAHNTIVSKALLAQQAQGERT